MKMVACEHCNYIGKIDYYNQYPEKQTWIIVGVLADGDLLQCPKCGQGNIVLAK